MEVKTKWQGEHRYIYIGFGVSHKGSVKAKIVRPGIVVDYNSDDEPIGLEIFNNFITVDEVNEVLASLGQEPLVSFD